MKKLLQIFNIIVPFALAIGILWWMYRGTDWHEMLNCVINDINWGWMTVSLAFGVVPLVFRALRWRMALLPMGEDASTRLCTDSIFLSYASSLVIPRVGEVTRCGTLKKYGGISFTKSLGTVVTERIIDSALMLLIAAIGFLSQLPQFLVFLEETGFDPHAVIDRFTSTGWWVTILCSILAVVFLGVLLRRLAIFRSINERMQGFLDGLISLRKVKNFPLYLLYSIGIWAGYYLHFYLAFFAFEFTSGIGPLAGLLIFCVGSFAVLVPTPNGAGPWHFAVKTMLVLYGVAEQPAILFAFVVHTIQTALVVLLGAIGWADLAFIPKRGVTGKTDDKFKE